MTGVGIAVLALYMSLGVVMGVAIHSAWMELRHDCLPHDPDYCAQSAHPRNRGAL